MIPFIIAGAVGFGIAKLLEKDTEKYAEGGKTGEIKDGDSVIMYFNQDTELEIFESEDLEEEPYIDVFKKGEKFEVDIFGVDDTIYDVQFGDGDVAFIRKNNVTIVSVNDKTFASGGVNRKFMSGGVNDMNSGVNEKEYLVKAIITDENEMEIPISVNVFAKSENSAMDKAEDNIREQNSKWEDFTIDIESVEIHKSKYAEGGKTGEIKDGDSVTMYFNQDTELEIFESEDLEEEPYIDVFKKGEKFEVDIFGVDDTIYDVQFGDGDVAFIRKNNVTIVSVNDKTFAEGGEAGEYSEEVEKILENLEPEGVKFEGNSREGFSVLVKDKNSDFSAFVDVYMQGSDVNWEWNQYIFARNNSMDMLQSELQDNIGIADYFSSEAIHYLEQQGAIQQDDNGDWSYTKKYESGGSVSKGYMVFNYTDNLYATYDVFKTKKLANDFIKEFRNRYSKQGYYRDNQMNKIDIEDIDLLAIPSNFNPFGKRN